MRDVCLVSSVAMRIMTSNVRIPPAVLHLMRGVGKMRGATLVASTLTYTTDSDGRTFSPHIVVRSKIYGLTSHSTLTNDVTAVSHLVHAVMRGTRVPLRSTIEVTSRAPTHVVNILSHGNALREKGSTSVVTLSHSLGIHTM